MKPAQTAAIPPICCIDEVIDMYESATIFRYPGAVFSVVAGIMRLITPIEHNHSNCYNLP